MTQMPIHQHSEENATKKKYKELKITRKNQKKIPCLKITTK